MPIKKISRSQNRTKRVNGALIEFQPINDIPGINNGLYYYDQATNRPQPLHPSIYSLKLEGHGFLPLWNFFLEEYYENRSFINHRQAWAYIGIAGLRNRGLRIVLTPDRKKKKVTTDDGDLQVHALDKYLGIDYRQLTKDIDRLEDCLLLHRIRRLDAHGTPNDFIIHTPFTPGQLATKWAKIIEQRIADEVTTTRRHKRMQWGMTKGGRQFTYLDRKADPEHRFSFDHLQIIKAFGQNTFRFAEFALKFFRSNFHYLTTDPQAFDRDYRDGLKLEMNLYDIHDNGRRELCYRAAHKFRQVFCPSHEELLTA